MPKETKISSTTLDKKKQKLKEELDLIVKRILQDGADADGFLISANFLKGEKLEHQNVSHNFRIGDWGTCIMHFSSEARKVSMAAQTGKSKSGGR